MVRKVGMPIGNNRFAELCCIAYAHLCRELKSKLRMKRSLCLSWGGLKCVHFSLQSQFSILQRGVARPFHFYVRGQKLINPLGTLMLYITILFSITLFVLSYLLTAFSKDYRIFTRCFALASGGLLAYVCIRLSDSISGSWQIVIMFICAMANLEGVLIIEALLLKRER